MKTSFSKHLLLALTLSSLIAAPLTEAARMGKSRSSGMQRSAPARTQQAAPPQQQATPPANAPGQAPGQARSGPGLGTAVAAGAAGAAAGYMLGSSGNEKAQPAEGATGKSASQAGSGMPWGTLALLGMVLIAGLMWFRRKTGNPADSRSQVGSGAVPASPGSFQDATRFDAIPKIGSGLGGPATFGGSGEMSSSPAPARLPDSTETPHFLRQAKATFLHLQSLNTPDSLEEVRKYMTPELYADLAADISSNTDIADFPQLDCSLSDASVENGRYIASVRFFGLVSESVNASPVPFTEYWHYVKDDSTNGKWLVAGIQQA